MIRTALVAIVLLALALVAAAQPATDRRGALGRAVALFESGKIQESVAAFDEFVRLSPADEPYLWQRGIAQYYAGQFKECRAQFEAHRLVNPDDVENAAWHFLCVARADSVAAARAALLPVGPDRRVPMHEVYQMFRGTTSPAAVMAAAGPRPEGQFYANLYVGLYEDAAGDRARAITHLTAAADGRFAGVGGYMHMVARVHLARQSAPR